MKVQKIGRNEPCPCGSGKKYKKCCLLKEQIGTPVEVEAEPMFPEEVDELDSLSNAVPHLVRTGRLDKAEEICRQLITRYPDQVDGLDRLASVYEAKGDKVRAAEYYRKAADFMRSRHGFDEEGIAWMENEAKRLDAEHEAEQIADTPPGKE
ncbi:MAG: SEC-C metal-binding domain-containing protein [Desulfomonilaceae bacterium]|nr:SEC-C metal-binding domain-containing protein [Desulfomonilaceae bacterium]